MSVAELKARLRDWHSTLAGVLIMAITVVVVLLFCHVITAAQIVSCADSATKILAMVAAGVSAIALMLTKSGNQEAAQVGKDMLQAAKTIETATAIVGQTCGKWETDVNQLNRHEPEHIDDNQMPVPTGYGQVSSPFTSDATGA